MAPHNYIAIQKPDAETFLPVYSLHSSSILEWECDGDLTVPGSGVGEEGGECFGTVVEQGDRESEMMGHRMMGMGDGKRERGLSCSFHLRTCPRFWTVVEQGDREKERER